MSETDQMSLDFGTGYPTVPNPAFEQESPPPPPRTPESTPKANAPTTPSGSESGDVRTSARRPQPRAFLTPTMDGPRAWTEVVRPRNTLVSIAERLESAEMQSAPKPKPRTKKVAQVVDAAEAKAKELAEAEAKQLAEARAAEAKKLAKEAEAKKQAEAKQARAARLAEAKEAKKKSIAEAKAKELAEAEAKERELALAENAAKWDRRHDLSRSSSAAAKGKELVDDDHGDDIYAQMLQNEQDAQDDEMEVDEFIANGFVGGFGVVGGEGGVGGVGGPARVPKKPPTGLRKVVPHVPKHGVIHPPPGVRMHGISTGGVFKGPPKRRLEVGCAKWHTSFPEERRAKKRKNAAQLKRFKFARYAEKEQLYYNAQTQAKKQFLKAEYSLRIKEHEQKAKRLATARANAKGTVHYKMAADKWTKHNWVHDREIMAVNLAVDGEDELCANHKAIYKEYKQLMKRAEWQSINAAAESDDE